VLSAFRILLINELLSILREKVALFWIFFFPFFFLAMMLIAYGQQGALGHITVEVVDGDHSTVSREYIAKVREAFAPGSAVHGEVVELRDPPRSPPSADVVRVTVPAGLHAAFAGAGPRGIAVDYDFSGGLSTQVAARVFSVLTTKFNAEQSGLRMPAKVEFHNSSGRRPVAYAQYLLTGILVMSMMTAGMNNTCIAIVDRRERNTFKLMACLPVSPGIYLAAILLARIVVLLFAAIILLMGARSAYSIELPLTAQQWGGAVALIAMAAVTLLSMGIALSSRLARVATAIFICNVAYLSLLFVSDLTMPLATYPRALHPVLTSLPTTQFVTALRAVLIQGSSLLSQWRPMLILTAWAAVSLLIGRASFHWHRA
jgi:ABC-2 type transport system permease protein